MAGRRDNPQPRAALLDDRTVLQVGMDYVSIRRRIEEETATSAIIKDRDSRAIRAHALRYKDTCLEIAFLKAVEASPCYGYNEKVTIKTDNEPALLDIRNEVIAKLPHGVLPLKPPRWSPRATDPSKPGSEHLRAY